MGDESSEMHSEDDKGFVEKKNRKRMVKTAAQRQALEKFFNEHKYPTEALKMQFAETVGLTEKQVSGWFCHRRLKDKKSMGGDNHHTGKQERSSGVIQDRGSGHKQDSCGSTKQGDDRNFDNKEVESGRVMSKDYSAVDLAHEHCTHYAGKYDSEDDTNSGSSSPFRDMPNHRDRGPFSNENLMHLMPKPEHERRLKARSGPSGYLKLKGRLENPAISAVKRRLGKRYRDEGPPLSVEFDPPPPGAFEFPTQNLPRERYYSGEVFPPAPSDASRAPQNFKFEEERGSYELSVGSFNNHVDGPSFKTRNEFSSPNGYTHPTFPQKTPPGNSGVYYPYRGSSVEQHEGSTRNILQTRPWPDHLPSGGKVRDNMKNDYTGSNPVREANPLNDCVSRPLANGSSQQVFKPPRRINEEHPVRQPTPDTFPRMYSIPRYGKVLPPDLSNDVESADTSSSYD